MAVQGAYVATLLEEAPGKLELNDNWTMDWGELQELPSGQRRHVSRAGAPAVALWRMTRAQVPLDWATDVQRRLVTVLAPQLYRSLIRLAFDQLLLCHLALLKLK